jgi:hypothetical protein
MTTTVAGDNRGLLEEADSNGAWTGSVTVQALTSPTPIEDSNCLGMAVGTSTDDAYTAITSDDYSGGGTLFVWMQTTGTMDTQTSGGIMIQVGDGTNRIGYHVGGSDGSAFRHETGPVQWQCFVLDLANKPANNTAFAGSEASLDETAITQVGVGFKTLSKALGGAANTFWDVIRFADNGQDVEFVGGTTSGAAGNAAEAATLDRTAGNVNGGTAYYALGVIRELGAGVYGIQGNITLGDSSSSSDQYWSETNATYAWEDRGLSSNNYYRFKLIGSSTATNCEFSFDACTFNVPSAASASFDGNGADITVCTIKNSTFIGFDQGITVSDDTGDDWTGNTYIDNDQVVAKGCDMTGSAFSGYLGAANTSALLYDLAVDPDGELDDCTFTMPATSTHAIEFGATIPSEITLRGMDFFGYGSTNNANDSIFHFKDTSGTITVNLIDCTNDGGGFSYRTDGATINLVIAPKTTKITTEDSNGTLLSGVRVLLETSSSGGFPYQAATSSLTQSAGTATLTASAAHGLATNDYVVVRGATPEGYNKTAQITVTSTTVFTYAVDSGLSTPAGGTPVFSYAPISGTTDGVGVISSSKSWPSSQSLSGWARKSTSSPYYKQTAISIADAKDGTDLLVAMQPDE